MPQHPIELSEVAEAQLDAFDPIIREGVVLRLIELRQDPQEHGRPTTTPPYPPGFQVCETTLIRHGKLNLISILFEHGDGGVLLIERFGIVTYG